MLCVPRGKSLIRQTDTSDEKNSECYHKKNVQSDWDEISDYQLKHRQRQLEKLITTSVCMARWRSSYGIKLAIRDCSFNASCCAVQCDLRQFVNTHCDIASVTKHCNIGTAALAGGVNKQTMRHNGPVPMVLQFQLVPGWRPQNRRSYTQFIQHRTGAMLCYIISEGNIHSKYTYRSKFFHILASFTDNLPGMTLMD